MCVCFGVFWVLFFPLHKHLPSWKTKVLYYILIKSEICPPILSLSSRNKKVYLQCPKPMSRYMAEVRFQICHQEHFWIFYTADFQSYPRYRTMPTAPWATESLCIPSRHGGLFQRYRRTAASHQEVSILQRSSPLSYSNIRQTQNPSISYLHLLTQSSPQWVHILNKTFRFGFTFVCVAVLQLQTPFQQIASPVKSSDCVELPKGEKLKNPLPLYSDLILRHTQQQNPLLIDF